MGKPRQERLRDLSMPQGCKPGRKDSNPGHEAAELATLEGQRPSGIFEGRGLPLDPSWAALGTLPTFSHGASGCSWTSSHTLCRNDRVGPSLPWELSVTAGLGAAGRRQSPRPPRLCFTKLSPPRLATQGDGRKGHFWNPPSGSEGFCGGHSTGNRAAAPRGKTWAHASDRPL